MVFLSRSCLKGCARHHRLLKTSWSYQAREFFDNSTLHGVRYIAEEGRPFYEKFMWFCSTSIGLVAALIIIVSLWEKFQTNPTITGLDTDFHNWDVPFPALTLCQADPSNETLVDAYIAKTWPDADEEKRAYYRGFLVGLANTSYTSMAALQPYSEDNSLPQTGLKNIVFEIVNRCDVLYDCAWKGDEPGACCQYFRPIFTEHGFCYTFNLKFNESEWPFPEDPKSRFKQEYIQETDLSWSMAIDNDNPQNNTISVFITSSEDMPGFEMAPQHVWTKRISKLSFATRETYTTADARQLSIRQRRCVFEDEIKLLTDDKYTYSACMRQCRMELSQKLCNCVPFFYPPVNPGKKTKIKFKTCDLKGLGCLSEHLHRFQADAIQCPCELGCMNTVYEMEKLHEANAEQDSAPLEVGFVSWPMVRYKREVLFGWVDLLVAFGGIAGLFLGFSLLSGVEIIYYFTLRAWCMVYRDREQLEKLQEEYSRVEKPKVDLSLRPTFMKSGDGDADDRRIDSGGAMIGGLGLAGGRIHPLGGGQRRRLSINNNAALQRQQAKWGNNLPYLP